MNKKFLYFSLVVEILCILALSFSLNGWVEMNDFPSSFSGILNRKIAINGVAIVFYCLLFLTYLILILLRKKNLGKFIYIIEIIGLILIIYVDVILMINVIDWIREGYVFSEIIILNAFSFVLVTEMVAYLTYSFIKDFIANNKIGRKQLQEKIDKLGE